ncbi:amidohydrolase family protein [Mucilaginibacter boryungensis]|uniref:Amidohydrolase n=1 Tax=Mucilaginibacter boryungensis TaxID=768480 RepID=A0ABR9XDK1_9SPHI|nr:amidohydrolase [Mucilaginibacter boryungensis]MBE9665468.1 amidohydrolase [Mucilaginibacter boryungensis]
MERREFLVGTSAFLAAMALKNKAFAVDESYPIIDIHQHTDYMGRTNDQLVNHQLKMGVSKTILLPSGSPVNYGSTHYGYSNGLQAKATGNEVCYALAQKYPDRFLFGANEVPDVPNAANEIEKYLKLGACVIGESKFNLECDSPEMQRTYQIAQEYNVPILMHWQYNMYNRGFERFHKMLSKYHKVTFIGHSQTWWGNVDKNLTNQNILYPQGKVTDGGLTTKYLNDYHNIFADISAGSGLKFLLRDEDYAKGFLNRFQDKILFGSDCYDPDATGPTCHGSNLIAAIRRLAPSVDISRKILYGNASKLFKITV